MINPAGERPSPLVEKPEEGSKAVEVKLCRLVKPVPSVLTANTVPPPEPPPVLAVPYRLVPDEINPARGLAPSALVEELSAVTLCRVVKVCAVTGPVSIKPRPATSADGRNRFLMSVFIG